MGIHTETPDRAQARNMALGRCSSLFFDLNDLFERYGKELFTITRPAKFHRPSRIPQDNLLAQGSSHWVERKTVPFYWGRHLAKGPLFPLS